MWRASAKLQLVHTDICGPMQTESLGRNKYFLLFIDDYTRMTWVYFLKAKSETFENFKRLRALVERQSGNRLMCLRSDRGGEFTSSEFYRYCNDHGIKRELTASYSPQQNGVSERKNRNIVEKARSLLKCRNLPKNFWGEAVATAVHLINISPTQAVKNKTPFEAWQGMKPTVNYLRIFGYIAYSLIPSQKLEKLDDKFVKCVFIGYYSKTRAYKLYDPTNCKVIVSRDVVFQKNIGWNWDVNQSSTSTLTVEDSEEGVVIPSNACDSSLREEPINSDSEGSNNSCPTSRATGMDNCQEQGHSDDSPPRRYKALSDIYQSCSFALNVAEPVTYIEAAKSENWRTAMDEEIDAVKRNDTWELIDLPQNKNVIGLKWVYKIKYGVDGNITRYKARIVAKGYVQQQGVDFDEVFAPVA